MKSFVYWNLHKKCWSIRAQEGAQRGRIVAHASEFEIRNARFKVSEAGRQKVLATKRKLVHAGVEGELVGLTIAKNWSAFCILEKQVDIKRMRGGFKVRYNPYERGVFVTTEGGYPVASSPRVQGFEDRTVLAHNPRWA